MSRGRVYRSNQRGPRGRRRNRRFGNRPPARRALPPSILSSHDRPRRGFRALGLATQFAVAALLGTLILFVIAVGAVAAGSIAGWSYVTTDLPNLDQVEAPQFQTTKIYDRNWKLLAEVVDPTTGYRTDVTFQEVEDHIAQQQDDPNAPHRAWIFDATVAAEDATFWTNPGVDPVAIVRSAFLELAGGRTGASTITQQLVRNLYTEKIGNERTLTRKIREAVVAYQFSKKYKKSTVLEMYLNQVFYGHRSYGIDAASLTYFNKHPWNLTL
ncbi:MAG TPA: transglycosylase domain-containing protein, partial [Nitrolancea sp.]|nr:transglycosylase domain-containing protein [Nitrolancea sp.]